VSKNLGVEKEIENPLYRERCHDCGVEVGQLHQLGCDVETCLQCGGQLITCGHLRPRKRRTARRGPSTWNGLPTGTAECIQWGWYARPTPDGWVACDKDEPDAQPHLNRLYEDAGWDRRTKTWVRLTDEQKENRTKVARGHQPTPVRAREGGGSRQWDFYDYLPGDDQPDLFWA